MEVRLKQHIVSTGLLCLIIVSILVLMEVRLKPLLGMCENLVSTGFNPCFNGSETKASFLIFLCFSGNFCFNPCFNGSETKAYNLIIT